MAKRKRLVLGGADPILRLSGRSDASPAPLRRTAPIGDVVGDVAIRAALEDVAAEMTAAREDGRLILSLPLDVIEEDYLIRDRVSVSEEEQSALIESLRARGQQTPAEVTSLENGRYGLISGWRRLAALRKLYAETSEPTFGQLLAVVRPAREGSDAYIAMVEENEIRANLSFYERARIAARAAEQGAFDSPRKAVRQLFASASRAKRSKINSFLVVYEALDADLRFPSAISERLGLALAQHLSAKGASEALGETLRSKMLRSADEELAVLAAAVKQGTSRRAPAPTSPQSGEECRLAITIRSKTEQIVLSGEGATAALAQDLKKWLENRGLHVERTRKTE